MLIFGKQAPYKRQTEQNLVVRFSTTCADTGIFPKEWKAVKVIYRPKINQHVITAPPHPRKKNCQLQRRTKKNPDKTTSRFCSFNDSNIHKKFD